MPKQAALPRIGRKSQASQKYRKEFQKIVYISARGDYNIPYAPHHGKGNHAHTSAYHS